MLLGRPQIALALGAGLLSLSVFSQAGTYRFDAEGNPIYPEQNGKPAKAAKKKKKPQASGAAAKRYAAAKIMYEEGDMPGARREAEAIVNSAPNYAPARELIKAIDAYSAKKRREEADASLSAAEDHSRKREFEQAIADYDKALSLAPGDQAAAAAKEQAKRLWASDLRREGLLLRESGNLKEAAAKLDKASSLDPDNAEIKDYRAKVKEEWQQRTAKEIRDANGEGVRLYAAGRIKEAIEIWEKALETDPSNDKLKENIKTAREDLKTRQ